MTRPRILILSAYYFPFQGGSETHARAVATDLSRRGFSVVIVTKRDDRDSPASDRIDAVPVFRVAPAGARTGTRKVAMIPFAIAKIWRLRREFDVIYCPGYQGIGLAAIAAGWWLRRPVVLRSGNLGVLRGDQWNAPLTRWRLSPNLAPIRWMKSLVRRVYMRADAFACNSRENEREAIECRVPPGHVYYLPNAVDVDRYRPAETGEKARVRSEQGWRADAQLCLYVGRLSMEKGVMDLLQAWRSVGASNRLLILIGPDMPGPLDAGPAARRFVADNNLQDRVVFHGASTDTARLLRAADVYVQPSHYESFSNALVEAMATGLPVVASRVGGMLDCIVDGENGLLSAPKDAADIANALRRVLDDAGLAARLGAAARTTVATQFSEPVIMTRFAELFEKVSRTT
jgi:glycosyltransferase involved in cell wall biosynthesis